MAYWSTSWVLGIWGHSSQASPGAWEQVVSLATFSSVPLWRSPRGDSVGGLCPARPQSQGDLQMPPGFPRRASTKPLGQGLAHSRCSIIHTRYKNNTELEDWSLSPGYLRNERQIAPPFSASLFRTELTMRETT